MIGSRLYDAVRTIVETMFPTVPFVGLTRYRVVKMAGDRAELQVVRKASGLPDVLPVAMHPGLAGTWAELAQGAEVLVTFIEGDPGLPIVTHFTPKGDGGFVPVKASVDASNTLDLGKSAGTVNVGKAFGAVNLGAAAGQVPRYGETVAIVTPGNPPVAVAQGTLCFGPPPANSGQMPQPLPIASVVKA